jgi:uncharacterized protein (TIGR03437 family)
MNLTPGTPVSIQINSSNGVGNTVQVNVYETAPGIFTAQQGGQGAIKAINASNNMLNTMATPAAKGSYITVYATGLGTVNPAVAAGQVTPASPVSPITKTDIAASIGGVPAAVTFAGLAPGLRGYYQVNIQVPQGAASGAQELIISTAGNPSQNGATVYVQ